MLGGVNSLNKGLEARENECGQEPRGARPELRSAEIPRPT